jgi:hypothetical protein
MASGGQRTRRTYRCNSSTCHGTGHAHNLSLLETLSRGLLLSNEYCARFLFVCLGESSLIVWYYVCVMDSLLSIRLLLLGC